MEHFLINSSVCLFVLWLFYKLALENTSWHHWKRFYLIASVGVSLIIPFIVVETIVLPVQENTMNFINIETAEVASEKQVFKIQWYFILMAIYSIGVVVMFLRFGKNLITFKIKEDDEIKNYQMYQLILRKGITVPHSFFNRIFVSAKDHKNNLIPNAVLEHEKAHLDQKHSLDILLIESLLVFFWFNPIFYILRYSMKLNHEFLADRSVIQQGIPTPQYQELILQHATNSYQHAMANTFHFPIIKKRFSIMKTQTSKANGLVRSLAIIPIITLLILSCGKQETEFEIENQKDLLEEQELIQEEQEEALSVEEAFGEKTIIILNNQSSGKVTVNEQDYSYKKEAGEYQFFHVDGTAFDYKSEGYKVIEITEVLEDITQEDIKEYNRLARKHKAYMDKNNTLIAWKDETTRMQTIFNSMSDAQRANNEPWPYLKEGTDIKAGQIPPPPPPAPPAPPAPPIDIKEIDQAFMNWRKENNSDHGFPTPIEYIDFYGDKMHYYIDGEKVRLKEAQEHIQKQDSKGVEIMPVNGVNSLKITTEMSEQ